MSAKPSTRPDSEIAVMPKPTFTSELEEISSRVEMLAAQLAGIRPITQMICDYGEHSADVGDAVESIGALTDYINRSLCAVAGSLKEIAREGGAACLN